MGQRARAKDRPAPIYRSRQAGRTDIEELLGPAFNPSQRPTTNLLEETSLPRPKESNDLFGPQPTDPKVNDALSTVDTGSPESLLVQTTQKVEDLRTNLQVDSETSFPGEAYEQLSTVVTDYVDDGAAAKAYALTTAHGLLTNALTTVDVESLPTVDSEREEKPDFFSLDTVGSQHKAREIANYVISHAERHTDPTTTVPSDYGSELQWITEQGQVVSEKQVRPFKMAQEVLNSNERVLYTVLWNNREAKIDPNHPHVRTVRAGYDYLAKQTNLAKKTIQRLIPRLMQKDFIRIEETPDFYNRVAASYRVFSYKHVLDIAAEQGRTHVAKLGHGVAFVRRSSNLSFIKSQKPLTAVVSDSKGTVPSGSLSTVPQKSTVSVPNPPLTTVVRKSTILESRTIRKEETTTAPPDLHEKLEILVPDIDKGAVERIWRESREVVADIHPEEVIYWFEQRAQMVYRNRGLTNPLGLLLSSIKDWLTERKVANRRNQFRELAEEEQRVRRQLEEDQHDGGRSERTGGPNGNSI